MPQVVKWPPQDAATQVFIGTKVGAMGWIKSFHNTLTVYDTSIGGSVSSRKFTSVFVITFFGVNLVSLNLDLESIGNRFRKYWESPPLFNIKRYLTYVAHQECVIVI